RLGEPAAATGPALLAEDLGELADELGQAGGLLPVASPLLLADDDVEAPLDEPAEVREAGLHLGALGAHGADLLDGTLGQLAEVGGVEEAVEVGHRDRKSTRLNSSHVKISYAVFCLKKKKN